MTGSDFPVGTQVYSIDGRYDGRVEAHDSYGWPIVELTYKRIYDGGRVRLYEAPGYWRRSA